MSHQPNIFKRAAAWLTGNTPAKGQVRRFEAARLDRMTSEWFATANSINQELHQDLDLLRRRGRQLVQNNDYAAKFKRMVEDNVVGPVGVRLQARVEDSPSKPDRLANAAIEQAWAEWSQACDVTGQLSFADLCTHIMGSMPADGEFLVRIVKGADAGNRFNFALQVIDVDRIDTTFNGSHGDNTVIMGVEVNPYRRPVAVHLFEAHPSDGARSSRRRIRVAADEMLHRFKVTRAEQVRGIPWMAPGMLSLHHLGGFMLSALLAAEHGANHYGFFTTPDGMAPIGQADASGATITATQPGIYDTLPQGVSFQPHESKYPNEVFGPFAKTCLQRIATGWGVAYHSLANDLEGVSFSSIRSGTLEERDRWTHDQEWFIGCFIEPVYKQWLQMALLSGAIVMPNGSALPASKAAKFARHEWQARRWEWVDPQSDMNAKVLAVKAGLMAPQDLCASMGYDYEDTIKAIGQAQALAAEFGVALTAYEGAPGAQTATNAGAQPTQANGGRSQATTDQPSHSAVTNDQAQRQHTELMAVIAGLNNRQTTVQLSTADIETQMRGLTDAMTAHIKEVATEMPIVVNVPQQAAPVVNVAAPVVNVTAPAVNFEATMPPAQVVVQHPTRAVQTVKRDANDEIVSTNTEYTIETRE